MAVSAAVVVVGLGAACAPAIAPSGPPTKTWSFETDRVWVQKSQDKSVFGINNSDDVYTVNLAFRVKVGQPGSAQVFVKRGARTPGLGDNEAWDMTGNQRAVTAFPDVAMLDVPDLLAGRKLEIVGVWTWAMERDFDYPESAVESLAATLKSLLNSVVASLTPPTSAEALVQHVIKTLVEEAGFVGVLKLLTTNLWHVTTIPDDPVGSRFYVGIGARGGLADVVDAVVGPGGYSLPAYDIPVVRVPPDINGGRVFRLGSPISGSLRNEQFTGSTGIYGMWFRFFDPSVPTTTTTTTQEPCEPVPPQLTCER